MLNGPGEQNLVQNSFQLKCRRKSNTWMQAGVGAHVNSTMALVTAARLGRSAIISIAPTWLI